MPRRARGQERLDGELMAAPDHPGQVADDRGRLEAADRGGLVDVEAPVHQPPGPFLGRDMLRRVDGLAGRGRGAEGGAGAGDAGAAEADLSSQGRAGAGGATDGVATGAA